MLPTLFECHRPVEQYARLPGPVRDAVGSAALRVSPLDAFLMHQLVSFLPGRPQVIDLTADDTAGASTVLWASHPGVRKVVAPARRGAAQT